MWRCQGLIHHCYGTTDAGIPAKTRNGAKRTIACKVRIRGRPVQSPHSSALCADSKKVQGSVSRSFDAMETNGESTSPSSELTERQRVFQIRMSICNHSPCLGLTMHSCATQRGSISSRRPCLMRSVKASYSAMNVGLWCTAKRELLSEQAKRLAWQH